DYGGVELVGLLTPRCEHALELLVQDSEARRVAGQAHAYGMRLACWNRDPVYRRSLSAVLLGIHGFGPSVDHIVVDAVLRVGWAIHAIEPMCIGLIAGEQEVRSALESHPASPIRGFVQFDRRR